MNFSVIILISGFRIPGFRVAEVSRLPLIKENKSKQKTLRVDMVFLIEARFDRIRTSYRQKTKAATQPESESADGFAILSEF